MADHNELGKKAEAAARDYLAALGYRIRHYNWTISGSKNELDIVCEKDGMLIVVEVKSRSTEYFEHPKDAVTNSKIRRIVQATHDYIMSYDLNCETRFDVISAFPQNDESFKIEHIEDAFLAPVN